MRTLPSLQFWTAGPLSARLLLSDAHPTIITILDSWAVIRKITTLGCAPYHHYNSGQLGRYPQDYYSRTCTLPSLQFWTAGPLSARLLLSDVHPTIITIL